MMSVMPVSVERRRGGGAAAEGAAMTDDTPIGWRFVIAFCAIAGCTLAIYLPVTL